MHKIQLDILKLNQTQNIDSLSLREIGTLIGVNHPQKVKHHIEQLKKKGILDSISISNNKSETQSFNTVLNIPILGEANCGYATKLAIEDLTGYLPVSKSIVKKDKNIYALKAVGNSMNKANVKGCCIDDGDYIIIDSEDKNVKDGDYVVSIINGAANVKRFYKDLPNNRVVLMPESSENFLPIIIHQDDLDNYIISGKVIQVVKKFTPN